MIDEVDLIKTFFKPLAKGAEAALNLEDDAALLKQELGHDLVISKDILLEDIHFLKSDHPETIAYKALAVNLSDIAAKGARPYGFLLGVALPTAPTKEWAAEFAQGLQKISQKYHCPLLGGDTTGSKSGLVISITILGTAPEGAMIKRSTAQPGDHLFLTGTIGDAALGLKLRLQPALASQWQLDSAAAAFLVDRYTNPTPRLEFVDLLATYASAAMDLSDGVVKDLEKLCQASKCSAQVDLPELPFSAPLQAVMKKADGIVDLALSWGDDYEILTTIPKEKALDFQNAAKTQGCKITHIGQITTGVAPPIYRDENGQKITIKAKTFDHF